MSISDYLELKLLDAVFSSTAYDNNGGVHVKLHTGDPGEACTANPATETTRQEATFTPAASGATSNDADIDWTSVAADETISFISLWDDPSAGNALWSGPLVPSKTLNVGDDFTIATGDLDISLA